MKRSVKEWFAIVILALFVLSLAIVLVLNLTPLYSWTAKSMDLAASVGLSHEELMENYHVLIRYLNFPWINQLNFPDFPSSPSGLFHFHEVKILFHINYAFFFFSLIISLLFGRYLRKNGRQAILIEPFRWIMLLPVVLLIFLALNFNQLFIIFHELLFNNDAWLFNPATDPIILVLPEKFFLVCFAFVFIFIEVIYFLIYYRAKRKTLRNY